MNKNNNDLPTSEEMALINAIRGNSIEEANEAWVELYKDIEAHIEKHAKESNWFLKAKEQDKHIRLAGWLGFVEIVKKYKSNKIDLYSSILNNIQFQIDRYYDKEISIPHMFSYKGKLGDPSIAWMARVDTEDNHHITLSPKNRYYIKSRNYAEKGKYNEERLALQITEILRKFTDENHGLSSDDLYYYLEAYWIIKYGNSSKSCSRNAFLKSVAEVLNELGQDNYCIKEKNTYISSLKMKEKEPQKVEKASSFEDISYVHPLDNNSMDCLIQLIYFSNTLSDNKKNELVSRLVSTTSIYYDTPFWNNTDHKFVSKTQNSTSEQCALSDNIQTIQNAINLLAQISFKYNRYNSNKELESISELTVSPYHLISYQGYYYLICSKEGDDQICHLRVDLMSDVVMESYADGIPVPIDIVPFEELPLFNPVWDPDEYSAKHLYMIPESPTDIRIRVSSKDSTIYTLFHDWFGNHFEIINKTSNDDFTDIKVKTSPSNIISFALQYSERIEILDDEIREKIKNKANEICKKYGNF